MTHVFPGALGHQLVIPTRRLPTDGLESWDGVLRGNYEGMVAKDPASAYTAGRTLSWLKVKQKGYRQEARGFHPGMNYPKCAVTVSTSSDDVRIS